MAYDPFAAQSAAIASRGAGMDKAIAARSPFPEPAPDQQQAAPQMMVGPGNAANALMAAGQAPTRAPDPLGNPNRPIDPMEQRADYFGTGTTNLGAQRAVMANNAFDRDRELARQRTQQAGPSSFTVT